MGLLEWLSKKYERYLAVKVSDQRPSAGKSGSIYKVGEELVPISSPAPWNHPRWKGL